MTTDVTGVRVAGYCPMGCGQTLTLTTPDEDNRVTVTCGSLLCPEPAAVDTILADRETEHIVTITEGAFTVKHPIRERLGDVLLHCELHLHIPALDSSPVKPGRYRARPDTNGSWAWTALPS